MRKSSTATSLHTLLVAGHGTGVPLDPPISIIGPDTPGPACRVVTNVSLAPEPTPMILVLSGSTQGVAVDFRPMVPAGSKITALGNEVKDCCPEELLHGL
jgi:hypothetical protein